MSLSVQEVGEGSRTAWILHGILGSGRNWRSFARKLADAHPGWRFVLPDLRNHGATGPLPGPHDLDACARDLDGLPHPDVIVGHSFGGKVALARAFMAPPARAVWVLDSIPLAIPDESDSDVTRVIAALHDVPERVGDRAEMREALDAHGLSSTLIAWLLTSLERDDDGWTWVYGLEGIDAMMRSYFSTDYGDQLASHSGVPIRLVRAARSDRWTRDVLDRLELGSSVRLDILPEAGHWLHVDNPNGLRTLMAPAFG